MARSILIAPCGLSQGAISVAQGVARVYERDGVKTTLFQPIARNLTMGRTYSSMFTFYEAAQFIAEDKLDDALERVVDQFKKLSTDHDVVVVVGVKNTRYTPFASEFNAALARSLNAKIIIAAQNEEKDLALLHQKIKNERHLLDPNNRNRILGVVLNRWGAPYDEYKRIRPDVPDLANPEPESRAQILAQCPSLSEDCKLLGIIPWSPKLLAVRVSDLVAMTNAEFINEGDAKERRVQNVKMLVLGARHVCGELKSDMLAITAGDRDDILIAAAMAEMNGTPLAGVLLCADYEPHPETMKLIKPALEMGLPIIKSRRSSYEVATRIPEIDHRIPMDDVERLDMSSEFIADHLDKEHFLSLVTHLDEKYLSPPAFRHLLVSQAKKAKKRIVLPEGEEHRTIQAAIICANKGIANPVLIGHRDKVESIAHAHNMTLPPTLEVLSPEAHQSRFVDGLVDLRKHKGMNEVRAASLLEDPIVLGTMMLQSGEVDGLVAGAVNTTAATILPALQLIKTKPQTKLVSSVFFMCLPEQVMVYGDCAVNPDPTAEELADIAIESAASAKAFGIEPKVAMISYSTGGSGSGSDVEKVIEATKIAQEKAPDLVIDGPLQFDAATTQSVAKSKAPNSPVAGKATVLIFPDLNTGNTTYKAVQRSAKVVSIGPLLQGLNKPVNDLSRGALVDDIVFTIALTAIQAID